MKRLRYFIPLFAVAAAAVAAAGCGDSGAECGSGTVDQDGICVPVDTTECGTGTVLSGGQCVPDGSVICEQGTVFDMDTGTCIVDPSACAAGTVLVAGECIPEDDLLPGMADHSEGVEPNGPGDENIAGMFDAPAVDASVSIYGCVEPTADADADGNLDEDLDAWLITASAPVVLEINADGIDGLAAGFLMINADAALSPDLDNWQRFGVNLTGDTSHRQVYLPAAGTYALLMADSRSLFLDAAGTTGACYYTTVTSRALPAATALTVPSTAGQNDGDVQVYSYQADTAGDILDLTLNTESAAMSPAFVANRVGQFLGSAAPDGGAPFWTWGGLAATNDLVEIIVDMEYNYGLSPQAFTLDSFDIGGQALPTTGTTLTVAKKNGDNTDAPYVNLNYLYFDVTGDGAVLHWDLTSDTPIDMRIVRRDIFTPAGAFDTVAIIDGFGGTGVSSFQDEFVRFLEPGRYYLVAQDPAGTSGDSYQITSTLTSMYISPVTYGTALTGQVLPAQGSGFHTLDLTDPVWVELAATGTDWGTDVRISAYDLAGEGWLDGGYSTEFAGTRDADGSNPFGRILVGDTRDYLVRVESTTTPGTTPTYDLAIGDRPHVNFMTITPGTPLTRTGDVVLANSFGQGSQDVARYIVFGAAPNSLDALVTPATAEASDVVVRRLGVAENNLAQFDDGLDGDEETLSATFGAAPANWVAFEVGSWDDEDSTIDLELSSVAPVPYTITTGTLAWSDACTNGTELLTAGDEELSAVQALPAAWSFSFFGQSVDEFLVSSNGFLLWGNTEPACEACYSNGGIPSATGPNGIIAAYWDDLEQIVMCREDDSVANTVTIQLTGMLYNDGTTQVETQLVLHMDGVIDVIYGPNHQATGSSATVGAENLSGTFGHQVLFNTAGISASTSRTLTPQ